MVRPVTLRKYSKYYYLARCSPIAHVGHDREMPARSSDSIHRLCIVLSSTFFFSHPIVIIKCNRIPSIEQQEED